MEKMTDVITTFRSIFAPSHGSNLLGHRLHGSDEETGRILASVAGRKDEVFIQDLQEKPLRG